MNKSLLLALPLALAGCISFGAEPPPSLLTLTSTAQAGARPAGTGQAASAVSVGVPDVSQKLANTRIPVQTGPTTLAYVKEAVWVEPPASLFQRLLSETITARTGRLVVEPAQYSFDPAVQLSVALREFGVDAATSSAMVVFDATATGDGTTIRTRRFEARVPVAAIERVAVADALNQAANQVAGEVADWIGG